jgi:hypothetical protein
MAGVIASNPLTAWIVVGVVVGFDAWKVLAPFTVCPVLVVTALITSAAV